MAKQIKCEDSAHCFLQLSLVHYEFVPAGQAMNLELYLTILHCLQQQCEINIQNLGWNTAGIITVILGTLQLGVAYKKQNSGGLTAILQP
jgi:hypothetical protein